jgi:hypothetical protein
MNSEQINGKPVASQPLFVRFNMRAAEVDFGAEIASLA